MARKPSGNLPSRIILAMLLTWISFPLFAEGDSRTAPVIPSAPSILNLVLTTVLVIIMIFAFLWVMKRMGGVRSFGGQQLRISAGLNLGPRERLVIADIEGQRLLLGVTANSISLLKELPAAPETHHHNGTVLSFSQQLQQVLKREPRQ